MYYQAYAIGGKNYPAQSGPLIFYHHTVILEYFNIKE